RKIIEYHGGMVTGNNSPDGGAVFTIFLPLPPQQPVMGDRVGGGVTPAVLPHHRAYGSVHGGS
ncbi:MAG: hypothetical protein Q8N45_11625, partial [Anaerolineales bacterium]|nr:hypothetical protein [Anaerolineales bacterium]